MTSHSLIFIVLLASHCIGCASIANASDPIILNDFEGTDYGDWKVSGDAFGKAPARGTLPGQMHVEGFMGKGLVNSFNGGDKTTGLLQSPKFKIERKFITFLIGGGGYANETCMNLLVDGKVVRTAAGPNTDSGGSELLGPATWEVTEFVGRDASITIVDEHKGGWGHINVDHIVLTDDRGTIPLVGKPSSPRPTTPEIIRLHRIEASFLQLPLVRNEDGRKPGLEKLSIEADGKLLRTMHVEMAKAEKQPDFWYSVDLRELKGKEVTFRYKSVDAKALERLEFGEIEIIDPKAYETLHRPRFHFSPRLGWMNDINGSYYQDGLYHIFYQFNPATTSKGAGFDMHWGHSVSKDLVHWEEWPVAIFPDATGQCYSGTTVMQQKPIPGLNEAVKLPAPVMFFAATEPFSQHIATTPDGGRTWKRFLGNPVVQNIGDGDRDPKVIWHEPSQHYVMVLYVGGPDTYRILRSKDLIRWEQTSTIPNWYECPEFLPMKSAVTGEDLMLLYGCYRTAKDAKDPFNSNSCFQLGRFDGKTFTPVTKLRNAHLGPNFYAALVFINEPKNRPIMIGWASGSRFPGEIFNQCASVPLLLQMKAMQGEDTLCIEPAEEVNALRGRPLSQLKNVTVDEANAKLQSLASDEALDVTIRFRTQASSKLDVNIRSIHFSYDSMTKILKRADTSRQLHPGESVDARFLIDRGIVESFWNHGEAAFTIGSLHTDSGIAFALEGNAVIEELVVYPMSDIWK